MKRVNRREFLRTAGAAALGAAAALPLLGQEPDKKSKVVLIRHKTVIGNGGELNPGILDGMLDEAVTALFEAASPHDAWTRVAGASDVVGIKTNVWRPLHTPPELEQTIRNRLVAAGVAPGNIDVDDRGILSNPIFQRATALVNVRPMRAHAWSGVGGCLKNYIMFTPSPADYHPDSCVDLGALWKLPAVKGKTRLNILLMLTPQFHCRAPHHFDSEYTWTYGGLLVSTDPVAVDAVGLRIIEAKRRLYFKEETPMRPPPKHIAAAEKKHGVGIASLERINLVRLGWREGILL
jgi:citrate lyase gamma subunit